MSNVNTPRVHIAFSYQDVANLTHGKKVLPVTVRIVRGDDRRAVIMRMEGEHQDAGLVLEHCFCTDDEASIETRIAEWVEGQAYHYRSLGGELAEIVLTRA